MPKVVFDSASPSAGAIASAQPAIKRLCIRIMFVPELMFSVQTDAASP